MGKSGGRPRAGRPKGQRGVGWDGVVGGWTNANRIAWQPRALPCARQYVAHAPVQARAWHAAVRVAPPRPKGPGSSAPGPGPRPMNNNAHEAPPPTPPPPPPPEATRKPRRPPRCRCPAPPSPAPTHRAAKQPLTWPVPPSRAPAPAAATARRLPPSSLTRLYVVVPSNGPCPWRLREPPPGFSSDARTPPGHLVKSGGRGTGRRRE